MARSFCTSDVTELQDHSVLPVGRDADADCVVLRLAGEHDLATVPLVAEALSEAMSADGADLIVDLSGVTFMGAATIGTLIEHRNRLLAQSRNLMLRYPSMIARRVLDVCGLNGLIVST